VSTKNHFGKLSSEQQRVEELKKLNAALDGKPTSSPETPPKKPKQNPKSDL
jgi:hypothetical protein